MFKVVRAFLRKKRLDKCRENKIEKLDNKLHLSLKNIPSDIKYRLVVINDNYSYPQYRNTNGNWVYMNLTEMLPEMSISDFTINNLFKSVDVDFIKEFLMMHPNIGETLDNNLDKLIDED